MSEVLEGQVDIPIIEGDAEEQVQPEEKPIDLNQLCYEKFVEFKEARRNAELEPGVRLIRTPIDRIEFSSAEDFREEMLNISRKVSRLSSAERAALLEIRNIVIYGLMQAKEESSKDVAEGEAE